MNRATLSRLLVVASAVVALAATAASASPSANAAPAETTASLTGVGVTVDIEPALSWMARLVKDLAPLTKVVVKGPATESFSVVIRTLATTKSLSEARQELATLLRSDSFYERAVAGAICNGMAFMVNHPDTPTTQQSWKDYLVNWITSYAKRQKIMYWPTRIEATANSVVTTWKLSQLSPQAARFYFQACTPR
jgi:hypothetical protein